MKTTLLLLVLVFSFAALSCESNEQISESNTGFANQPAAGEWTAGDLRAAALSGDIQIVNESIEQGISVDDTDDLGRTPLMFAAFNGHNKVVDLLIENGAEVNLENDEGRTSLIFAASGHFPETVRLLIKNGAELNVQDSVEEWSALMYAAAEGNNDVVELLLANGADPSLEDKDGETSADFASNNGHTDTVNLLKEN
ncbi:ankyrin repeat domain-containing protein [Rhodohalobacter sp. 8-1]|uniref:ankyrin repeat domain-containing protein n=1 Tax=Rhodohalobacter sp. 8-1 TaxID=3131972 RepID=UPI0030EC97CC